MMQESKTQTANKQDEGTREETETCKCITNPTQHNQKIKEQHLTP